MSDNLPDAPLAWFWSKIQFSAGRSRDGNSHHFRTPAETLQ
jgi:hypothetical protein